jgi:hypothetical protein
MQRLGVKEKYSLVVKKGITASSRWSKEYPIAAFNPDRMIRGRECDSEYI